MTTFEGKRVLIYDCETLCVPSTGGEKKAGVKYADGWRDFKNLGIACIGFWSSWQGFDIVPESALSRFQSFADEADEIVGFNSKRFDDLLCQANGIEIKTTYDLLLESWEAAGLDPAYTFPKDGDPSVRAKYAGFRLDDLAIANLSRRKTSTGAKAPELWQQGKFRKVLNYCLRDVTLTRDLLCLGLQGKLWHGATRQFLKIKKI